MKRIWPYVGEEPFMLTYGDGVSDVNLDALLQFHQEHGRMLTITTVSAGQRFGILDINAKSEITAFREKEDTDGSMINAGFMVCNPEIFSYIEGDETVFEKGPLTRAAADGQLMAYQHNGFWKCMDTQREKNQLEQLWASGHAPWKTWDD